MTGVQTCALPISVPSTVISVKTSPWVPSSGEESTTSELRPVTWLVPVPVASSSPHSDQVMAVTALAGAEQSRVT